ncbi:MAG: DUF2520 domain-containing protein [Sandaracinaceae bacterium]
MNVVILGRGRLGHGLRRRLQETSVSVRLTSGHAPRGPFEGAVVLAVPDPAVAAVASALIPRLSAGTPILHCSGSLGPAVLAPLREAGCAVGVMHPLVSFASPTRPPSLVGTSFLIDGDPKAVRAATTIAKALEARPVQAEVHGPAYHAAAAMSANGAAALSMVAVRVMESIGLSTRDAQRAVGALLRTVGENIERVGVPDALSGPVLRGDHRAVERHRDALQQLDPDAVRAYDAVAPAILDCAVRTGLPADKAERVRAALRSV